MNVELEVFLDSFIQTQKNKFSLAAIVALLGIKRNEDAISYIRNWLDTNQMIFCLGKDEYITRSCLFTDRIFSILPNRFEITSNILIVGHRCIPFGNPDLLPTEYVFSYKGKIVKTTAISLQTNDIYDYYNLFGEEFVAQYLSMDKANESFDFVSNDYELPGKMNLTVLDMADVYKESAFKSGDRLRVTVENWRKGVFSLAVQKDLRENRFVVDETEKQREHWFSLLENAFVRSFDEYGPRASIDEQVVCAYITGGSSLFTTNCGSLEELMRKTEKIEVTEYGVETRLWRTDEKIPAGSSWSDNGQSCMDSELGKFFFTVGVPVSEVLIDSFIYDSCYRREKNCDAVLARLMPGIEAMTTKERLFCLLHLEKRRAIISRSYNWFADYEPGQLRSKMLGFYTEMLVFVYNLSQAGIEPDNLPQQPLVILSQLFTHLSRMLESLNIGNNLSADDISSMHLSLEGMQFSFSDLKEELEMSVGVQNKFKFSVVKKDVEKNERN